MEKKLKITPNKWEQSHRIIDEDGMYGTEVFSGDTIICTMHWAGEKIENTTHSRREGNAKLIADAGNTAQKCDLLPSELLKQRDDLLNTLSLLIKSIDPQDVCAIRFGSDYYVGSKRIPSDEAVFESVRLIKELSNTSKNG